MNDKMKTLMLFFCVFTVQTLSINLQDTTVIRLFGAIQGPTEQTWAFPPPNISSGLVISQLRTDEHDQKRESCFRPLARKGSFIFSVIQVLRSRQ